MWTSSFEKRKLEYANFNKNLATAVCGGCFLRKYRKTEEKYSDKV